MRVLEAQSEARLRNDAAGSIFTTRGQRDGFLAVPVGCGAFAATQAGAAIFGVFQLIRFSQKVPIKDLSHPC